MLWYYVVYHVVYCAEVVILYTVDVLDRTNISPLHIATNNNNLSVVTALLNAGADPDLHGIGGATALHIGVGTPVMPQYALHNN